MEQDLLNKLNEQEKKIDAIYASVEKTRKYFMWTLIISIVFFIVPLIALVFIAPSFVNTYTQGLNLGI